MKERHVLIRAGLASEVRRTLVLPARDRRPRVALARRRFRAPARANKRAKHASIQEGNDLWSLERVARLHSFNGSNVEIRFVGPHAQGLRSARHWVYPRALE